MGLQHANSKVIHLVSGLATFTVWDNAGVPIKRMFDLRLPTFCGRNALNKVSWTDIDAHVTCKHCLRRLSRKPISWNAFTKEVQKQSARMERWATKR